MAGTTTDTGSRKLRLRRRSMAAVSCALTTLLGLQLAYHHPLSQWWPALYDFQYGPRLSRLRALLQSRSSDQPLVIAFGSSLTAMGLRPGELTAGHGSAGKQPLIFNCGIKSGTVVVQQICLRRLLAEGIHPDLVLLEISPRLCLRNPGIAPHTLQHLSADRLLRSDLPLISKYHADAHRIRVEWREGQCMPWYFHRSVLMNWFLPNWLPERERNRWRTDEWGWDSCPAYYEAAKSWYRSPQYVEAIRELGATWSQWQFYEELSDAVAELLTLCRTEGIEAVVVWPPESSFVRAGYSPDLQDRCRRWLARLHAETGVPLINARDWVDDAKFADGSHLNPDGARDYTLKLERELRKRLVAAGHENTKEPGP